MNFKQTLPTATKYGTYGGGIIAAYFLLLYLFNQNYTKFALITFVIEATVVVIFSLQAVKKIRDEKFNGTITYFNTFFTQFMVIFLSLAIYLAVRLLICFFIDPQYFESIKIFTLEQFMKTRDMMPDWANDPEKVKQGFTFVAQMSYILVFLVKSLILGSLLALITRKKPKIPETI